MKTVPLFSGRMLKILPPVRLNCGRMRKTVKNIFASYILLTPSAVRII
jgi:hypothetical protein